METRNHKWNQFGGIDCEVNHEQFGWIPFTASPNTEDPAIEEVWQLVKDRTDITAFEPPSFWKEEAKAAVRRERDTFLKQLTDPNETDVGRQAWSAKATSAQAILLGKDKLAAQFGLSALPPAVDRAFDQIHSSMSYLAESRGQTLQEFAFEVALGKSLGFSAFVWLADEVTQKSWDAIDQLPDGAEGYKQLDSLNQQLKAQASRVVKDITGG